MYLQITHETHYDYTPAVDTAQHIAMLRPRASAQQTLISHTLRVDPEPHTFTPVVDVFGNTRVFFDLLQTHSHLTVVADSVLATLAPAMPSLQAWRSPWEAACQPFRYQAGAGYDSAVEFTFPSPLCPLTDGTDAQINPYVNYAAQSFPPGVPWLTAVCNLMQRIHRDFIFSTDSTQVNTPTHQAFAQRSGVCQDFSHIMISCLRSLGLSARYVSGYLLTHPAPGQPRLIGADASHAWVSAYLNGQWFDFCPTNARWGLGTPGEDYVSVAFGRDFSDVSPLRGIIHGGFRHELRVAVTVMPLVRLSGPSETNDQAGGAQQ
jgi:transglutaminase-like putative cysteine protease